MPLFVGISALPPCNIIQVSLEIASMSFRVTVSTMTVGLFALAIAVSAQSGPRATTPIGVKLAQAMQAKHGSTKTTKRKVKKKKSSYRGNGSTKPQPVHVGPPDPGKY